MQFTIIKSGKTNEMKTTYVIDSCTISTALCNLTKVPNGSSSFIQWMFPNFPLCLKVGGDFASDRASSVVHRQCLELPF